jgi:hypothetical protein
MGGEVYFSLGALERNHLLELWIMSWAREEGIVTLIPEGWFSECPCTGHFLWAAPPVAATAAMDQMYDDVQKRTYCMYVFVCTLIVMNI